MKVHCRVHEFGPVKPKMRVWTDEMIGYGQFNVVDFNVVNDLHVVLGRLGECGLCIGEIILHHCDTQEDCNCKPVPLNEPFDIE